MFYILYHSPWPVAAILSVSKNFFIVKTTSLLMLLMLPAPLDLRGAAWLVGIVGGLSVTFSWLGTFQLYHSLHFSHHEPSTGDPWFQFLLTTFGSEGGKFSW
jgi:hypothetical protein